MVLPSALDDARSAANMKVRWTSESVRLRITPAELAGLGQGEAQRLEISFPGGQRWAVRVEPNGPPLGLRWVEDVLVVHLSRADVERLSEPDREGIYLGGARAAEIRLLIEKDFPCAHPHAEEAAEPETERFAPTDAYLARKAEQGDGTLAAFRAGSGTRVSA
jgi:Family of unknown function (DUF7009)